jgi:hypothetical protein
MKFSPKQLIIDKAEFDQMESELEYLKRPPEEGGLTKDEQEEATGILLVRALQNPRLFQQTHSTSIDLGKYKAIFVDIFMKEEIPGPPKVHIRFVRT